MKRLVHQLSHWYSNKLVKRTLSNRHMYQDIVHLRSGAYVTMVTFVFIGRFMLHTFLLICIRLWVQKKTC